MSHYPASLAPLSPLGMSLNRIWEARPASQTFNTIYSSPIQQFEKSSERSMRKRIPMQTRAAFQRIPNSYGQARYTEAFGTKRCHMAPTAKNDLDSIEDLEETGTAEQFFSDLHFVIQSTNPSSHHGTATREDVWAYFEAVWAKVHENNINGFEQTATFITTFGSIVREAIAIRDATTHDALPERLRLAPKPLK